MRTKLNKRKAKKRTNNHKLMPLHRTRKYLKLNCSPNAPNKPYSCLSDEALYELKKFWNARHSDVPVVANNPEGIWSDLKNKLSNVCNKESCWLRQRFVNGRLNRILQNAFAPKSPTEWEKDPNTWLTSIDIMNVMKQYEQKYKCFDFIGPSPIDFDKRLVDGECVWNELCSFHLASQMRSGKTKIGIIFNTDTHDKGGSHWISLFINIRKKFIFFYDSVGTKAPPEVDTFAERVKEQGKKMNPPIEFTYDSNHPTEHQYSNTECGVYSLYFIINMLRDKLTGDYLKKHKLRDKYIESFRKIFFNPEV